jgi:amphi-Trp domain-containing protein
MSIETNDFKFESMQDTVSIGQYLNSLCEGFSRQHLVLRSEENTFVVKPYGLLKFEIKARKKSDRVKLKLEISWKDGIEEEDESSQLVISSKT